MVLFKEEAGLIEASYIDLGITPWLRKSHSRKPIIINNRSKMGYRKSRYRIMIYIYKAASSTSYSGLEHLQPRYLLKFVVTPVHHTIL